MYIVPAGLCDYHPKSVSMLIAENSEKPWSQEQLWIGISSK